METLRYYTPMHGGLWRGRRNRDSQEHRAVEYARWLAQRDGATLPSAEARITVAWRKAPDGRQRPCAVTFGAVRIALPHWDHIERPPTMEYEVDVHDY